jgi:RimJ/RimL family protein N-acetyltransferase
MVARHYVDGMSPINPDLVNATVLQAAAKLRHVADDRAAMPIREGEWSGKELVGHLVDSTLNNYQRIIRAQIIEHRDADGVLRFPSYAQEQWVERGGYRDQAWSDLLDLWVAVSKQLCAALRIFEPAAIDVPLSIGGEDPHPIRSALDFVDHLQQHVDDLLSMVSEESKLRQLPSEIIVDSELCLRRPRETDGPAIIAAVQDPEIPRWTTVPSPYGETEFAAWFAQANKRAVLHDLRRNYLIVDTDETVLGMVGLVRVRPDDENAEVGYWLGKESRGKGVITRSLTALIREILRAGYARIDAEVLVGNPASQRVLERVGFTHEGVLRSIGSHGWGENAKRIDVHVYSIILADPIAVQLLSE